MKLHGQQAKLSSFGYFAPRFLKNSWPFLFVVGGFYLLFGGFSFFAEATGFPYWWPAQPEIWSAQAATKFSLYSLFASASCWLGLGMIFFGFVAAGCILKQANRRQPAATSLGVITLLCAIWELGVCADGYLLCHYTTLMGYSFDPATLFYTFPPAVVCTVLSLVLVGPRKSKIAWISLCLFSVPLWETLAMIPTWHDYINEKYLIVE